MRVYANVNVEVNVADVLDELSDEDFAEYASDRAKAPAGNTTLLLERCFEEFQRRGDAPRILADYFYEVLGRIL